MRGPKESTVSNDAIGQSADQAPRARTAGMSIQKKLPLLIGGLLLGVMAIFTAASYQGVKDAALTVGRQRLVSLTDQLAKLYEQSLKDFGKAMHVIATDSSIHQFVASGGVRSRAEAMAVLQKAGPRPENTMRSEVLDLDHRPLLSIPDGGQERHEELSAEFERAATGPDFAATGRFRLLNDTLVVPSVAAVLDGNRPIGYLVRWRRISASPQAREQLSKLLGANAGLYVGNDRGDVWTDLAAAAPKPPIDVHMAPGATREYTRPGGSPVIATSEAVPGAPWVALVEFSRDAIMAPADRFLQRAIAIGVVVLILGALGTWWLSRSITQPLGQLTHAATALAAGDYTAALDVGPSRGDEFGRLSDAFNTMVQRVAEAQQGLEQRVQERTAELQDRNEELETFAHSISHDLRAPLRAMHGFSRALLEDCGPQLDVTGQDYAQRVVGAANRMDLLIQDLLAYSRVSRAEMDLVPVDLEEVTSDALGQLEADLDVSMATVSVASPLPTVVGHKATLVQAVVNLVGNGLKFVPKGQTPAIQLRAEQRNGVTRLWVEDNGIGIDAAHHDRVFGIFQRLHQSEDYPGTGIGLAIVRKSVERMGGRVGVESTSGNGSRFWIELRRAGGTT
jgi:signal transduction histidine kinase